MKNKVNYQEAQDLILSNAACVGTERISLENSFRRILAEDLIAAENVPAFDRSPYDGFAFRAVDTKGVSKEHTVTLRIVEEIAAGDVSHIPVTEGTAVRLMTGAPIPVGAGQIGELLVGSALVAVQIGMGEGIFDACKALLIPASVLILLQADQP